MPTKPTQVKKSENFVSMGGKPQKRPRGIRFVRRMKALSLLTKPTPIKEIARRLGVSVRAVYFLRKNLMKAGLVGPFNTLTSKGEAELKRFLASPVGVANLHDGENFIRLHDIGVELLIVSKPLDYEQRREAMESLNLQGWKAWRLRSNALLTSWLASEAVRVRTTPKRVILTAREVWGKDEVEAKLALQRLVEPVVAEVERRLNVKAAARGVLRFRIQRQHIAHVDALTRLFAALVQDGWRITIRDERGEKRVELDASLGVVETEFPHPRDAGDDSAKYKALLYDVVVRGESIHGHEERLRMVEDGIKRLLEAFAVPQKPKELRGYG